MGVRLTVQVTANPGQLLDDIFGRVVRGKNQAAERLLALSKEVVPYDLGDLSRSGTVVPATTVDEDSAVTYDTPYARRLHEHPEYTFRNGRRGKYLSGPAEENRAELAAIVRKAVTGGR